MQCYCSNVSASGTRSVSSSRSVLRRLAVWLMVLVLLLTPAMDLSPAARALDAGDIQIGDYLRLGHISFHTDFSGDNDKDLTWQVIDEEGGKLLLFLADNLFAGQFDASDHAVQNSGTTVRSYGSSSWRTSDVRTWLNSYTEHVRYDKYSHFDYSKYGVGMAQISDFGTKDEPSYRSLPGFLNGFSIQEQCLIETREHAYLSAYTEDVSPCNNCTSSTYGTDFENAPSIYAETTPALIRDDVFLLSALEYRTCVVERGLQQDVYFDNKDQLLPTDFWLSDSLFFNGMNTWLFYGMCNLYVTQSHQPASGYTGNHGVLAPSNGYFLRPACWIDASYIAEIDGSGTLKDPYTLTIDPSVLSRADAKNIYQSHPDKWTITVLANKRDPDKPNAADAYRLAPNAQIVTPEGGVYTTNDLGWVEVPFSYGGVTVSLPGYFQRTLDCMQVTENQTIYLEPETDQPALLGVWVGNHDALHSLYTLDLMTESESVVKIEFANQKNGGAAELLQGKKKKVLGQTSRDVVKWGNENDQYDPSAPIYVQLTDANGSVTVERQLQLTAAGLMPEELPDSVTFSFFGNGSGITFDRLGDKAKVLKDVGLSFDLSLPYKTECQVEDGKFYFVAGLAPSFKKDVSTGTASKENPNKEGKWSLKSGIDMLSDIAKNKNDAKEAYKTLKEKKALVSSATNSAAFTGQFQLLYYAEGYVNAEGKAITRNQGGIVGGGAGGKGTVPLGVAIGPLPLFLKWSFGGDVAYRFRCKTSDLVDASTRALTPDANLDFSFEAKGSLNAGFSDVASVGGGIKGNLDFSMDFKQYQLTSAYVDGDITPFVNGQLLWLSGEAEFRSLKDAVGFHDKLYEWPEKRSAAGLGSEAQASGAAQYDASVYRAVNLKTGGAVELGSDYPISSLGAGYVCSEPQIVELGDGKLLACYIASADNPDNLALTARYYDGTSWSAPITVENNATADLYPSVWVNNGTAWVAWTDLSGSAVGMALDDLAPLTRIHAASFDPDSLSFTTCEISAPDGTAQLAPVMASLNGAPQIAWRANRGGDWFGLSGTEVRTAAVDGEAFSSPETISAVDTPITSMIMLGDRVFWTADLDGSLSTADDTELFCNGTRLTNNDVPDVGLCKANGWAYWLQDDELLSLYWDNYEAEPYDDETEITGLNYKILSNGNGTRLALWIDQPTDEDGTPVGGTQLYARYYNYTDRTWADETFCLTDGSASVLDYSATLDSSLNLQIVVLAENENKDGSELYTITVPYAADLSLDSVEYIGACYMDNAPLELEMALTNHGTKPVTAFKLEVTDDEGNTVLQDIRSQTIDPGQTVTVPLPLDVTAAKANVNLHAQVTAGGTEDTNPANNACDFTLNWEDLSLENLRWALDEDGNAAVIGSVVNRGYGSYDTVTVALRVGTPDGEILQTQTLSGMSTLSSKAVSFVVPYREDTVYYVSIEQANPDDRSGNDNDFVVLQSESHYSWTKSDKPDTIVVTTELDKAISEAELLNGDDYTSESFTSLKEVLETAKTVRATQDADQDEIDAAAKTVNNAIDSLVVTESGVDKKELEKAIAAADILDAKKYTEETMKVLTDAVEHAKAIQVAEGVTRAEVVTAMKAVYDAINALNPINQFRFNDVKNEKAFYFDAVYWAYEHSPQITNGTDSTHFSPDAICTRGQVVTFLWRAAGCPTPSGTSNPFMDVKSNSFYYKAVLWAVEKNITKGISADRFGPDQGCTRGQVVTFLHRFAGTPEPGTTENPFGDVKDGAFYYKAVLWAVEKNVTKGTGATVFSPDATCTRGQIVTFLYRATKEE